MELLNEVQRVLEVAGWVPGVIRVVETSPLDLILDLIPMAS